MHDTDNAYSHRQQLSTSTTANRWQRHLFVCSTVRNQRCSFCSEDMQTQLQHIQTQWQRHRSNDKNWQRILQTETACSSLDQTRASQTSSQTDAWRSLTLPHVQFRLLQQKTINICTNIN